MKPGIDLRSHCPILTIGSSQPTYHFDPMIRQVLRVDPSSPGQVFDPKSLVDFSKVYTVEYHCRVNSHGQITPEMKSILRHYCTEWLGGPKPPFDDGRGERGTGSPTNLEYMGANQDLNPQEPVARIVSLDGYSRPYDTPRDHTLEGQYRPYDTSQDHTLEGHYRPHDTPQDHTLDEYSRPYDTPPDHTLEGQHPPYDTPQDHTLERHYRSYVILLRTIRSSCTTDHTMILLIIIRSRGITDHTMIFLRALRSRLTAHQPYQLTSPCYPRRDM